MIKMIKDALEWVEKHPRIILLLAWPVFTALVVFLILVIWKGGWVTIPSIQLKQLDILGSIALGLLAILGLNQLAQSSTFFGKVGLKLGSLVDVSADMDADEEKKAD